MGIATLVVWILTALGGFYLLAKWVGGGGHRQETTTHLPPAVVFSHFLLAATGLVLWIIYLIVDSLTVGWIALIVLAPVAILGLVMFVRWIPTYRDQSAPNVPERSFPVAVVGGHGVLAVTTVVLALITLVSVAAEH